MGKVRPVYICGIQPNQKPMRKTLTHLSIFILMIVSGSSLSAQCSELFFSEYIEGSTDNKAIEIYNGTGGDVDLSDYSVETYFNGNESPSVTLHLSGILGNQSIYIIGKSGANPSILLVADITSNVANFNGNDAVILRSDVSGKITPQEKAVSNAWKAYNDHLNDRRVERAETQQAWVDEGEVKFAKLLYEMSMALGYDYDEVQLRRDSYRPVAHSDIETEQRAVLTGLAKLFGANTALRVEVVAAADAEGTGSDGARAPSNV